MCGPASVSAQPATSRRCTSMSWWMARSAAMVSRSCAWLSATAEISSERSLPGLWTTWAHSAASRSSSAALTSTRRRSTSAAPVSQAR